MTVAELIEKLEKLPRNAVVVNDKNEFMSNVEAFPCRIRTGYSSDFVVRHPKGRGVAVRLVGWRELSDGTMVEG